MRTPASSLASRAPRHPLEGVTVLQIIPNLDGGGSEQSVLEHVAALAEVGARPLVATRGGRLIGEMQAKGGVWTPFPAHTKNPIQMALNVRRLAQLARNEGVDIIHAHSRAPAWSALGAARRLRIPLVTSYHGFYDRSSYAKGRYNSVMARGDIVLANSQFTAGLIQRNWPEAVPRVRIVPCGVDLATFDARAVSPERVAALRSRWGLEPHQRAVLLPARMSHWKGHRVLIDAARILNEQGLQDVAFIMAGRGDEHERYVRELDGLIAAAGLDQIVRRVGHCDDMPAGYLAAAAVTVPSTEPETFGRIAVEAQAVGAPVIASDLGAAPETILAPPDAAANLRTGWRTAVGDAPALADAISQALALGASARSALAARARSHVSNRFSLAQAAAATIAAYIDASGAISGRSDAPTG
ncbi:glycosyltransferase family 4 protein [Terrarubrum flagellatum]|uniref:glycosyltransferase family 4 protein n=1 Tax=Terrirubrum flagellatum TaxID=2895980 RepID=UPI003144E3FE